jgi:hypothetical protein
MILNSACINIYSCNKFQASISPGPRWPTGAALLKPRQDAAGPGRGRTMHAGQGMCGQRGGACSLPPVDYGWPLVAPDIRGWSPPPALAVFARSERPAPGDGRSPSAAPAMGPGRPVTELDSGIGSTRRAEPRMSTPPGPFEGPGAPGIGREPITCRLTDLRSAVNRRPGPRPGGCAGRRDARTDQNRQGARLNVWPDRCWQQDI